MSKLAVPLLIASSIGACSSYEPYAHYTAEERAKLMADLEIRSRQQEQKREQLRQGDTLSLETLAYRLRSGDTTPVEGVMSRGDDDVFEGRWKVHEDPYTGARRYTYDKGSYRSSFNHGIAQAGNGLYRGDFLYFQDPPSGKTLPTATFVMIGSFTRHDGAQDTGIYVAENSYSSMPLHFIKATPAYLERIEQRYQRQVANYREEQLRLAREAQASEASMFNFGQLLALGLGGLMLASADIPGADRMEIGTALFKDVMSQGQTDALASLAREKSGSYAASTAAGGNLRSASAASAASSRPGAAASAPGQTTSYSFTCPSGQSSTVSISYKTTSCLAAKKDMTRIYACNMVNDFNKIPALCSSACGTPQCTD
ncbi:hypothetical protein [Paracandidimonas soli]|uniref:hypothetical protein n=1 Tax=Paracandidimonas soli TaxID=1917182 RepID=UPI00333E4305